MPVIFGTALAVVIGGARFSPLLFLWALATMVVYHAAANMLSDVYDFRHGLDRDVTPVSGAVVRGWLTDRQVFRGAALLFGLATISGLLIAWVAGRSLLVIGAVGLAVGVFYTVLKAHSLGDLAVFLDFGLLGGAGAWVVQTGSFSWLPVLWTVPMAMLVIAILHANNWRDTASDGQRHVKTVAGLLGDKGSLVYYGGLIFGPFVIDLAFIARAEDLRRPAAPDALDLSPGPARAAQRTQSLGPGRKARLAPPTDGFRHPRRGDGQSQPRLRPAQHGGRHPRGIPAVGMSGQRSRPDQRLVGAAGALAAILFIALFRLRRLGPLDFWAWLALNIIIVVALAFLIDSSYTQRIRQDLRSGLLRKGGSRRRFGRRALCRLCRRAHRGPAHLPLRRGRDRQRLRSEGRRAGPPRRRAHRPRHRTRGGALLARDFFKSGRERRQAALTDSL